MGRIMSFSTISFARFWTLLFKRVSRLGSVGVDDVALGFGVDDADVGVADNLDMEDAGEPLTLFVLSTLSATAAPALAFARFHPFSPGYCITVTVHPPTKATPLQGTQFPVISTTTVTSTNPMKSADDLLSSEKLVSGVIAAANASCKRLKSSILFCRSRMFRKKSRLRSGTGCIVGGGLRGGEDVM